MNTPAPSTFVAHGKTWYPHIPGEPMPCPADAKVEVLMQGELHFGYKKAVASGNNWNWEALPDEFECEIIGWRYADEQAAKKTKPVNPWMPIETAPMDGTEFIGYGDVPQCNSKVIQTRWVEYDPRSISGMEFLKGNGPKGEFNVGIANFSRSWKPLFWMPLAEPPAD